MFKKNNESDIEKALESLERSHQAIQNELDSLKEKPFKEAGKLFVSPAETLTNSAMGHFQDLFHNAQGKFGTVLASVGEEVKTNPWMFLGKVASTSFGVGVILAKKLKSRKEHVDEKNHDDRSAAYGL